MLEFLIYLLAFIIGSIIGLLYSYKQHGEPFIVKGLNVVMCVVSVIGWMLAVNCQFSQGLIAVGLLLAGFVIGERPGYGRIETLIGIIAAVIVYLIKKRVIGSFKWQEDIIIPFSKEFGCTTEDLEDLFMDLLDMSSLEALHGTLEIANHKCLLERLDADLRLPWYVDVLELLSVEQGDELKNKVANEIIDGKSYDIALDEGRKDLFNLLKNINNE